MHTLARPCPLTKQDPARSARLGLRRAHVKGAATSMASAAPAAMAALRVAGVGDGSRRCGSMHGEMRVEVCARDARTR